MSIAAIAWAFKQKLSSSSEKFVLVKLADNANDEGLAWPSLNRIQADTALSRNTVLSCISALEKKGLLRIERRREGSVNLRNQYWLLLDVFITEKKPKRKGGPRTKRGSSTIEPVVQPLDGGSATIAPITVIEPSEKTTTTTEAPVVVPSSKKEKDDPSKTVSPQAETEKVKEIMAVTSGTPLEGMIPESVIPSLISDYRREAHQEHQPELAPEGIKRLIRWTAAQMSDPRAAPIVNPVAFLRARAKKGMDKPPALTRQEQAVEAERREAEERRRKKEQAEKARREDIDISEEIRRWNAEFCRGTAGGTEREEAGKIIPSPQNVIPLRRQG